MEQIDSFIATFTASEWVYWAIFVLAVAEASALTSFLLSGTIGLVVVGVLIAQGMLNPIFSIAAVYVGTLIGDVTTFLLSSQLQKIRYIRSAIERFEPIREPLGNAPARFILAGHFTPYLRAVLPVLVGPSWLRIMSEDRSFPDRLFPGAPVIPTGPPEQEVIMGHSQDEDVGAIGAVPVCKSCGSERVALDAWACWNPEFGLWELEHVFDDAHCHACEDTTTLVWKRLDGAEPRQAIRELNDRFRREGRGNGTVVVTPGVRALGEDFLQRAFQAVRDFDQFSEDNDPWGEHDYGAVEIDGEKVFWKLDYYDPTLTQSSENPANEALTQRLLTIMLASEY